VPASILAKVAKQLVIDSKGTDKAAANALAKQGKLAIVKLGKRTVYTLPELSLPVRAAKGKTILARDLLQLEKDFKQYGQGFWQKYGRVDLVALGVVKTKQAACHATTVSRGPKFSNWLKALKRAQELLR
jgi:hypothetical protein